MLKIELEYLTNKLNEAKRKYHEYKFRCNSAECAVLLKLGDDVYNISLKRALVLRKLNQ